MKLPEKQIQERRFKKSSCWFDRQADPCLLVLRSKLLLKIKKTNQNKYLLRITGGGNNEELLQWRSKPKHLHYSEFKLYLSPQPRQPKCSSLKGTSLEVISDFCFFKVILQWHDHWEIVRAAGTKHAPSATCWASPAVAGTHLGSQHGHPTNYLDGNSTRYSRSQSNKIRACKSLTQHKCRVDGIRFTLFYWDFRHGILPYVCIYWFHHILHNG